MSSRDTRSVSMEPVQASPFLPATASYGALHGVGVFHSFIDAVDGSNMPMRSAWYSANQTLPSWSTRPRRGREFGVGVRYTVSALDLASIFAMLPAEKSSRYTLLSASACKP